MDNEKIIQAKESIERIQNFDINLIPRKEELGAAFNFDEAVEPVSRLVGLYRQLTIDVLNQLPDGVITQIKAQADGDFNIIDAIIKFNPLNIQNPTAEQKQHITKIENAYDNTFNKLHPFISYSVRQSNDFSRLEREARSHIQDAKYRTEELKKELDNQINEANRFLETVRKVAEEQGVSQQAIYFKNEADIHEKLSKNWLWATSILTIILVIYACFTLFIHKIDFFSPINIYETTQLIVSKILIFVTISFFLILSARNYLAHRHNLIVNRHRQNALATYQALVKAAGAEANRDIVLAKAADCIFTAQATGFSKFEGAEASNISLVNVPGDINAKVPL